LAEELQRKDIIKIHLIVTSMRKANGEGGFHSLITETQKPLASSFLVDILK